MKIKNFIAILCLVFSPCLWAQAPELTGKLTQGGLIVGKVTPESEVLINGKPVEVNQSGVFVLGFGRDAKLSHTLAWKLPGESSLKSMPITLSKRDYNIDYIEGVASKYVSPAKSVLARIRQENAAIAQARRTISELNDFQTGFIMPAEGRISGVYGSQRYFNGEPRRPHFGLDIANTTGTPVIAPAGGIVTLSFNDMYYSGGTLILDHGLGVSSTFIHLSKLHVTKGERVEQGELIGEIGATGRVTGPHLDWRINWLNERLDPALLFDRDIMVEPKP